MPSTTPIGIIGCGGASLLLLLLFSSEGIPPEDITIIDPYFDGGDLQRSWAPVKSNTPWKKLWTAIQSLNPAWKEPQGRWAPKETAPLSALIRTLRESVNSYLQKCVLVYDTAWSATYTNSWEIQCKGSKYTSQLLFVCTGSQPKSLSLPIPSIPLVKALTSEGLRHYIEPQNHVLVFGSQHSGTLVIDALMKVGCQHITVIHRRPAENPFLFARDGEYDGIKEESEAIADRILQNPPSSLEFVNQSDFPKMARALRTADWVVYAIGFTAREQLRIYSGGAQVPLEGYDATTGKLPTLSGFAWGFGIAFPNRAPDGKHYDVSLHSFAEHILKQKAEILVAYRSLLPTKITNT